MEQKKMHRYSLLAGDVIQICGVPVRLLGDVEVETGTDIAGYLKEYSEGRDAHRCLSSHLITDGDADATQSSPKSTTKRSSSSSISGRSKS